MKWDKDKHKDVMTNSRDVFWQPDKKDERLEVGGGMLRASLEAATDRMITDIVDRIRTGRFKSGYEQYVAAFEKLKQGEGAVALADKNPKSWHERYFFSPRARREMDKLRQAWLHRVAEDHVYYCRTEEEFWDLLIELASDRVAQDQAAGEEPEEPEMQRVA
tara:strand:+ start:239 stop:724 length:486 start_codon:yes stop_codon:yes gene_type:complete